MRWPWRRGLDQLRLVVHQLVAAGGRSDAGSGSAMQDVAPAPANSKERKSGPSSSQVARRWVSGLRSAAEKSGARNGLASWREIDRLRDDPALGRGRGGGLVDLGDLLDLGLEAGGGDHLLAQLLGRVGDDGVLGEQREERGVAGGGLGEDRGDAVEPLELLVALRLGQLGVALDPDPLLAGEQRDDLELGAHAGHRRAALDGVLDLAHGAGEDRDDPVVVERTSPSVALVGPALG